MLSNGPGVPSKSLAEHQAQFDEYINKLGISSELDGAAKLCALRSILFQRLIDVQRDMTISEFRALSDGAFMPLDLSKSIINGDFARKMKSRNITLLSGECRDEHTIYYHWRTPGDSCSSVYTRLCAEYPEKIVAKLMQRHCGLPTAIQFDSGVLASQNGCCGLASASPCSFNLPAGYKDWRDFFGRMYAKLQVHCLERGFHNALFKGGLRPGKDVLRYRFDRRLECVDDTMLPEWGVTHASDIPIWFWGFDSPRGLTDQEKVWLQGWNEGFATFVRGDVVEWGPTEPKEMRKWRSDGKTDVWEDDLWEQGLEMWDLIYMDEATDVAA
jgi:carboxylesterase type B